MEDREHFFSLLDGFSEGMMVTHAADGELHARPMAKAQAEANGDLLLVAHAESGKVAELQKDARTCMTFQQGRKYLSLNGEVRIEQDRARVVALWQEPWRLWFPQGPTDPNIVLLHVRAQHGSYWDNSGAQAVRFAFAALQAAVRGAAMEPPSGQQGSVPLKH